MSKKVDRIAFPKQDNFGKYSYNERVLDAIASFFHVRTECAAAVKYKDILYISYNKQIPTSDQFTIRVANLLFKAICQSHLEDLLILYLVLNEDFNGFIKLQFKHEANSEFKNLLEKFKQQQTKLKFELQQNILNDKYELAQFAAIAEDYRIIIGKIPKNSSPEITEQFLRPLQDSLKVSYTIANGYKISGMKILDNKDNIHAEYNITMHFPIAQDLESHYIGITKLCCGYCHEYLKLKGYAHRGTHGVCDEGWKMYLDSPQFVDFKKQLLSKSKEIEAGKEPLQCRRLSFDVFEQHITELYSCKRILCASKSLPDEMKSSSSSSGEGLSIPPIHESAIEGSLLGSIAVASSSS